MSQLYYRVGIEIVLPPREARQPLPLVRPPQSPLNSRIHANIFRNSRIHAIIFRNSRNPDFSKIGETFTQIGEIGGNLLFTHRKFTLNSL